MGLCFKAIVTIALSSIVQIVVAAEVMNTPLFQVGVAVRDGKAALSQHMYKKHPAHRGGGARYEHTHKYTGIKLHLLACNYVIYLQLININVYALFLQQTKPS